MQRTTRGQTSGFAALAAASARVLRAHPLVSAALGAAVLFAFAALLFGVGAIIAPWFVCELFAVQLAFHTGAPPARSFAWIRAGALLASIGGTVAIATSVAALAIGPDVATADSANAPLPWSDAAQTVAAIAAVTALTVAFVAPFQYAPLILIDRGGTTGAAVVESAWLVRRGGLARHVLLAFLAHVLPIAPAIALAVAAARTFERAATPVGFLVGLTVLPFSIPFGQGILTAAYVARRLELAKPTAAVARPPLALRALLAVALIGPACALFAIAFGALRSAPPLPGPAAGELVLERTIERPAVLFVPETTLEVRVHGRDVSIESGDGSGAGRLERRWNGAIAALRVRRARDEYAIEITTADGTWHTTVDRAGVRVDDAVRARIARRIPRWALPAIALSLAACALGVVRVLAPLGARRHAAPEPLTVSWSIGAVLAVLSTIALFGGMHALLG